MEGYHNKAETLSTGTIRVMAGKVINENDKNHVSLEKIALLAENFKMDLNKYQTCKPCSENHTCKSCSENLEKPRLFYEDILLESDSNESEDEDPELKFDTGVLSHVVNNASIQKLNEMEFLEEALSECELDNGVLFVSSGRNNWLLNRITITEICLLHALTRSDRSSLSHSFVGRFQRGDRSKILNPLIELFDE